MVTTIVISAAVTLIGLVVFYFVNKKITTKSINKKLFTEIGDAVDGIFSELKDPLENIQDLGVRIEELSEKIDNKTEDLLSEIEEEGIKELLKVNFKKYLINSLTEEVKKEEAVKEQEEEEEELDEELDDDGFIEEKIEETDIKQPQG